MYIPLKVTTDNSLLKSLIKIQDLISFCVQKDIKVCGICDTNLFGVIEFYNACKNNKIKPLIGLEVNINNKIVYLYAENKLGYKNLLKIHTIITERDITLEEFKQYSNHLLVILPYNSRDLFNEFNFVNNLYIGYETKTERTNALIKTQNVIYINDIKVFKQEDMEYLKYLDLISNTKNEYHNNYFNVQDLDDFDYEKFAEINNLIDIDLTNSERYIPKYCENSYEYLTNLCLKGLKKRLNNNVSKEYVDRLKYELSIINKMGFVDYFLIVYDYVLYAKKNHILVGPGRGSAAGSLVSYVTGITDIDPLKYNLLFERFLNPERVSMPDIDIDFDNTKRDLVIDYVKNKYGNLNVSGGITFQTLKARSVLREISKILNIDNNLFNKFIQVIDKNKTLKDNLNNELVLKYLNSYKELKKMYSICLKLEGLKKNISTHAAGIVIASVPLDEIIPMYKNNDLYLTGITMDHLENLGLLKMDFLALKNLNIISRIITHIPNFNLNNIDLEDKLVYELFCNANTDGIFQFETATFKNMLLKYKPKSFKELVASIALVRPGPINELETYIRRKEGKEKITYYDESLKDILEETYGVIVYQEQVISILVRMANFSYAEADNIRRAMAKKKENIIKEEENNFLKRSVLNGYDELLAKKIYNAILEFASYGFNKSHSVAYALVSYQMAYLKVHYNVLFNFVLLDNSIGSSELIKKYLNELKNNQLQIKKVDINISTNNFKLKDGCVYLPFKLIKNLKGEVIEEIIKERNTNGLYKDIFDFFKRTYNFITKNEYLILIKSSSLDKFNLNTNELLNNLDSLIEYGNLYKDIGSLTLIPEIKKTKELTEDILREYELESYGIYISNHPASKYNSKEIIKINKMNNYVFKNIVCYVMIENVKKIKTKKNEDMAFIVASDETGVFEFTLFPKKYYLIEKLNKNSLVRIWGTVSKRFDKYNVIINNVEGV